MGRKSQSKSQRNAKFHQKSDGVMTQMRELTDQLLRICSTASPSGNKLLDEHKSISSILEKINKLEENIHLPVNSREDNFPTFLQWVKENGVDVDNISVARFDEESWGLKAEKEIEEGSLWLTVPRQLMVAASDLNSTDLADVLKKDPITKHFPQVGLALFILHERFDSNSKYKPYLDILPSSYDTVLYFSVAEFEELKGCSCLDEALKHYRHIVRQYAYFWQMFNNVEEKSFTLREHFSFNSYRWAVSTVMTRQNAIPSSNGSESVISLIPVWDMCNHLHGQVSTDFNLERNELLCYAQKRISKGDQIFISYGERSNGEFFVYNAFVSKINPNDSVVLKLGISKDDQLATRKTSILQDMGVNQNEPFYLVNSPNPISDRLLAFVRVFTMTEDDLNKYFSDNVNSLAKQLNLLQLDTSLELSVCRKAWAFLKIRLELLLKSYKTTLQEDEVLLAKKSELASNRIALAVEVRAAEKRILHQTLQYVALQLEKCD
ncbi:Histone-lysine N-methyltransferase setd3 [Chamberlinius hualienensis]